MSSTGRPTSSSFHEAQDKAWEKASKNAFEKCHAKDIKTREPKANAMKASTKEYEVERLSNPTLPGKITKPMTTDWQQVWNSAKIKHSSSSVEQSQEYIWVKANTEQGLNQKLRRKNTKAASVKGEDSEYDAAAPLVDYQRACKDVQLTKGLTEKAEGLILKEAENTKIKAWEGSDLNLPRSNLPFPKSSIVFSDSHKASSKPDSASSSAISSMFQCVPIPKEEATTALGTGESWYIVQEEEVNEEWEMLDGEDVDDEWDSVPKAQRCRVEEGKKGWNQMMREFFEGEKIERERQWKL